MRSLETRNEALRLVAAGVNDCEIARRLGVPRTTVRDWRKPRYEPKRPSGARCPRCDNPSRRIVLEPEAYAELLGLYLGDGHITKLVRSQRLRLFLDAKYATIVNDSERLLRSTFPENRVGRIRAEEGRMAVLWTYSSHLTCLFPQHGEGKKHERRILLEPWQQELVDAAPWAFLRGCIRSDGCVFINRMGRIRVVRLRKTVPRHPRALRRDLRTGRCRLPCVQEVRADQSPGERRPDARARRSKAMSTHAKLHAVCGCGGTWQTRGVQVAVGVTPWRFESSQPHSLRLVACERS